MISQSDIDQILLQYDDLPMDSAVTVEITDALSGDTEKHIILISSDVININTELN
jgi:hypothetical protein